jgi:hypothetical protein
VVVCAYEHRAERPADLSTVPVGRLFGDQRLRCSRPT